MMPTEVRKRTLILMRHAKSDWSHPALADHDRPLNQRGIRTATSIGRHLEQMQLPLEVILCSTAHRAQQTLQLMQNVWRQLKPRSETSERLYLANPETILSEVRRVDPNCEGLMIIGHNPGLSELATGLAGRESAFPTAAIAIFSTIGPSWANVGQQSNWCLEAFLRPRELGL